MNRVSSIAEARREFLAGVAFYNEADGYGFLAKRGREDKVLAVCGLFK